MIEATLDGQSNKGKRKQIVQAVKKEVKKKHWMQKPENRAKVMARIKQMHKARRKAVNNA